MNHIQNILKIGGSLGSLAFASSIDPTGGFICKAIEAVSGNLLSNFVNKYDPAALLEFLKKPSELNHDIEKLMIDSVEKAVKLVTVKYLDENPYEDKFVKDTLQRLIDDANIYAGNLDNEIIGTDKDAWIGAIHEYIFRGQPDEDGKLAEIAKFFNENLKSSYELVFNEGLKDDKNEKPLKAFLIKSLTGLNEQVDKNSEIQQKILDEIQLLKDNKPCQSLSIGKAYFEEQFNKIDKKLVELLDIAKASEGKIDLIIKLLIEWKKELEELKEGQKELIEGQKELKEGQDKIAEKLDKALETQAPSIPHYLTNPPFLSEYFIPRDSDLEAIRQKLFEENNLLILVNGVGGVGKTSLATRYFHRYQDQYAHVAWVLSEKSIANALLLLANKLDMSFNDTDTADERVAKVISKMATLQKPCLLVIDNANEPEDLDNHYQALRTCSNFHLLLTSRITDFRNAESYKIEGLPFADALQLFTKYYSRHQPEQNELFENLYIAVDKNTLVIELLAKNLHLLNKFEPSYQLPDLLQDLQSKGLLALSQSKEVDLAYQKFKKAKPQDVIAAMYDLAELNPAETRLLSVMAVLPAERIAYQSLKALLPNTTDLADTLQNLMQKGWIDYNDADNTLKCSPVIQEITQAKNQNLYADCEEMIRALIDKLDYETGVGTLLNATYEEGVLHARFAESVIANLEDIQNNLGILCEYLGNFHKTHGNIEKAIIYTENYISISKKLVEQYPENETFKNNLAISYSKLGGLQQSLGNLDKALEYFEQYNQLENELYRDYPNQVSFKNSLAISYAKLGDLQQSLGNLDKALTFFEKYNQLENELYRDYPNQVDFKNGLAISYQYLGNLEKELGNLEKALGYYEKYNQLENELYRDYPNQVSFKNGLAISYSKLGDLQKNLGNLEKALEYFEKDCKITEELYRDYPNQVEFKNGLAISYAKLGEFYRDNAQKQEAIEYF